MVTAAIRSTWIAHLETPFPASVRGTTVEGIDLVLLDSLAAGCIQSLLGASGPSDMEKISLLTDLAQDMRSVLPHLAGEARAWYAELEDIATAVLEYMKAKGARAEQFLIPWEPIPVEHVALLEAELKAEVGPEHPLYDRPARALARRSDRDDVLFVVESPRQFAIVHLTYGSHPEPPPWPPTDLFPSLNEFIANRMVPDPEEF